MTPQQKKKKNPCRCFFVPDPPPPRRRTYVRKALRESSRPVLRPSGGEYFFIFFCPFRQLDPLRRACGGNVLHTKYISTLIP